MTHEDRIRKLRSLGAINARTARYLRQFCAALDLGDWHGCEGAILNMQSEAVRIAAASHVAGIVAMMRQVLADERAAEQTPVYVCRICGATPNMGPHSEACPRFPGVASAIEGRPFDKIATGYISTGWSDKK